MSDNFSSHSSGLESPATRAAEVTPNDSTDLTYTSRALYVGGSGDVTLTTAGGDTVTLVGVPAGTILPIRAARVWATDTDATSIVSIW